MSANLLVRNIGINPNSASADAFGRLRTSGTGQRLDVEFNYNKQVEFFDEVTNNGTVTYNGNPRDLTLSLSDANNGSYAWMSSHPVPYTPGNSQLIDITGVLDLAGIGGGTAEIFIRTKVSGSVVETATPQSSWSSRTSGVDWTDSHIFSIDLQSLKVGRIRFGMVTNGVFSQVATIFNDNVRNTGYWQIATLPVYWRLYNDATYTYMELGYGDTSNAVGFRYKVTANASATMKAICCTVKSEGGQSLPDLPGLPFAADRAQTAVTASTTLVPIMSIRPRSTFGGFPNLSLVLPKSAYLSVTNQVRAVALLGATLTNASWTNVDTNNSCTEYDVSATAVTGGIKVSSGYVSSLSKNSATATQGILSKVPLWNRLGSETGIFTIAAIRTGVSDADCLASIEWEEIR